MLDLENMSDDEFCILVTKKKSWIRKAIEAILKKLKKIRNHNS